MHLIQMLLPLYDNEGREFSHEIYRDIGDELVARFSGLTAFTRAPAEGHWMPAGNETKRDDIMIFEVMAPKIDEKWWTEYRKTLEKRLRQESIVIRSYAIRLLRRRMVSLKRKSDLALTRAFFARDAVSVARDLIGV